VHDSRPAPRHDSRHRSIATPHTVDAAHLSPGDAKIWRATLSGLCASLVGIGMARFAYTPLLPAIIGSGWFSAASAVYLGAANLTGYLIGTLLAGPAATRVNARLLLRGAMLAASISFFACAWPVGFAWFFAWRLGSGIAGGIVMVLTATTILPQVAPARRGLVAGAIFMGVGFGVAASGTLVPLLLGQGLQQAWLGLGVAALALTLIGWNGWPTPGRVPPRSSAKLQGGEKRQLLVLYAGYGLNAFGLVPHMVFLVDYVARGLGQGMAIGASYWVLFGLGAVIGPLVTGHVADRIGFRAALRLAYLVEVAIVVLPSLNNGWVALMVSSFFAGAFTPGVIPLALGRTHEVLRHHPAAQKRAWGTATTSFAVMQAAGAYGLSFIFARTGGNYALLFELAAGALGLALILDLLVPQPARQEEAHHP
jgi:predicted MFS family arabinose efflux permease